MKQAKLWTRVNVVCVTYNNEDTVEPLLTNLLEHRDRIAELVIHDNGSDDATALRVSNLLECESTLSAKLVKGENVGFGAGIFGASQALADLTLPTLCINPDAELRAGTLEQMLKTLNSNPALGIITAPLVRANGELDSASVRKLPRFGQSLAYSVLGKLVPERFRYNATRLEDLAKLSAEVTGTGYSLIEATTGALMLINPLFRPATDSIFDLEYWMYGEDLQLCKDASEEGFGVAIIDWPPSLHLKGVSSGWPRGVVANRAFHQALYLYYAKNMARTRVDRFAAKLALESKLALSDSSGRIVRRLRSLYQS